MAAAPLSSRSSRRSSLKSLRLKFYGYGWSEALRHKGFWKNLLRPLMCAQVGTKSTLEEKKERVRAERQIRLASIVDRYRSQIVVQPVGARILLLPTFHCWFVSAVSPSAVLEASFCPMLKEFLPVDCPNCTALAKSFTLSAGNMVVRPAANDF